MACNKNKRHFPLKIHRPFTMTACCSLSVFQQVAGYAIYGTRIHGIPSHSDENGFFYLIFCVSFFFASLASYKVKLNSHGAHWMFQFPIEKIRFMWCDDKKKQFSLLNHSPKYRGKYGHYETPNWEANKFYHLMDIQVAFWMAVILCVCGFNFSLVPTRVDLRCV